MRGRSRESSRQARGRGSYRARGGHHHTSAASAAGEREWSTTFSEVAVEPFIQTTGPTVPISSDPTEVFLQFFTPYLIEHIVAEANRYAAECLAATHTGEGPVPQWETSVAEVKAYLGFSILMGLNRLPDFYDYWSTSEIFHYYPVASRISRKRFLEIKRFLHFSRNADIVPCGQPGYDRLAKVRPIIDAVRQSFIAKYNPHKKNAIDEAMIPFKGRSSLKQYLPKKPVKRGFKVYVRKSTFLSVYTLILQVVRLMISYHNYLHKLQ